jgi:hypothetical protein
MKCYAIDVDETLEISGGPVTITSLVELVKAGHIVGICGNWGLFVQRVQGWHWISSFLNVLTPKAEFLAHLKLYVPAEEYVMVGNATRLGAQSYDDETAAQQAGWRFILEKNFAAGER